MRNRSTCSASRKAFIASKAITIGNVAGAGPPSYDEPVASAKARTRSSVTANGGSVGSCRPTSDWSTGMTPT